MIAVKNLLLSKRKIKTLRISAFKKRRNRYKVFRLNKKIKRKLLKKNRLNFIHSRYIIKKFINLLIKKGKKVKVFRFLFNVFLRIRLITRRSPILFFLYAVKQLKPFAKVVKVRKAGKVYDVPTPLSKKKQLFLTLNWLVNVIKNQQKKKIENLLSIEVLNVCYNKGDSFKLKKRLIRKVYDNRSILHFRWQ